MNIVVLNGSPKGEKSVTLQYIHYLQHHFPRHRLEIIHISQPIRKIETDYPYFQALMDKIEDADGILWATPVYYFLVPSNYKRFIELIFERGVQSIFRGKATAVLTTSIHFFDHTAHNYLHAICDDLDMKYLGYYSADMLDLLKKKERDRLERFAASLFTQIQSGATLPKRFMPLAWRDFQYFPAAPLPTFDSGNHRIVLITDVTDPNTNLGRMQQQLKSALGADIDWINLHTLNTKGSCLGCMHCAWDNTCVYTGKDDFGDVFLNRIMEADILILAGTIRDRYLSSIWKQFFDRSFMRGHTPSLAGKQIGLIISGPLSQNANLRQILEAYAELQQANLAGIVTDEFGDASQIDTHLADLSSRLVDGARRKWVSTPTFLGVAGAILFRDEIWGRLRFPFRADYLEYRRSGRFRFPHQAWRSRVRNAIFLFLSRSPRFRKAINRRIKDEMIKPFKKFIAE